MPEENKPQPVAWGVHNCFGRLDEVFMSRTAAEKYARLHHNEAVVPLYRQPQLTDEEREAVETAIATLNAYRYPTLPAAAATIRKLLERMQ